MRVSDFVQKALEEKRFSYLDAHFALTLLKKEEQTENSIDCLGHLMQAARSGYPCVEYKKKAALPKRLVAYKDSLDGPLQKPFVIYRDQLYFQRNFVLKIKLTKAISSFFQNPPCFSGSFLTIPELNVEQQKAVEMGLTNPLSLISGGPGTGKTYLLTHIIRAFIKQNKDAKIILAAPTGKAAARLREMTAQLEPELQNKIEIATLHLILKINKRGKRRENQHLACNLVIVDECSMIDLSLWAHLFDAISEKTSLILVGDQNQLPPVEMGAFFGELCDFAQKEKEECFIHLSRCMRSEQKQILALASEVNNANTDQVIKMLDEKIFFPIEKLTHEYWQDVARNFHSQSDTFPDLAVLFQSLGAFRVLSCLQRGPLGVKSLNEKIYHHICQSYKQGQWIAIPIMVMQNSRQLDLYNGEMGFLIRNTIDQTYTSKDIAYFPKEKKVPIFMLPSFEYAYCISVHKSQGSEYEQIKLVIPPGAEAFGKEILYTGITRVREKLEIISDIEIITNCLKLSSKKHLALS